MSNGAWTPEGVPIDFIRTDEAACIQLAHIRQATRVAIDTETVIERDEDGEIIPRDLDADGPGPWRVMSIAADFADGSRHAWVLDMGYIHGEVIAHLFEGLRPFGWNANFDRGVLTRGGIPLKDWWDAMLADAVLRCGAGGADGRKYTSLAEASRSVLGYDIEGKAGTRLDYQTVEDRPELTEDEKRYAAYDAIITLEVAVRLGPRLREEDLLDTFVRECAGQPFINWMTKAGFPVDKDGYNVDVRAAEVKANAASERIAVATTGKELLSTLVTWDKVTNGSPEPDDVVTYGLSLLHNEQTFWAFLNDVKDAKDRAVTQIQNLLNLAAKEDLFNEAADATYVPMPFEIDEDTRIRAWLSKTYPHFAAAYVVAAREEGDLAALLAGDAAAALEVAGRRRKLTKDHAVDDVLTFIINTGGADIDVTGVGVATELLAARRYERILDTYNLLEVEEGAELKALLVPDWNVDSDDQLKDMLNVYSLAEVHAYMSESVGEARLLGKSDSVNADAMKMIGGELCSAVLEYRKNAKIVTTYGDEFLKFINANSGRIHARYNQALTGTGRLSSFKPNAQNLSPLVKPHIRPSPAGQDIRRVLVCADLSQAELRFVADASQDVNMMDAFHAGDDLHERTAGLMFGLNMKPLKESQQPLAQLVGLIEGLERHAAETPDRLAGALYKELRSKAKSVAFGYAYGLKGLALSKQLTVQGVPTTKEEADELLAAFDVAYPQVAAWMAVRVNYIKGLSDAMRSTDGPSGVDFVATWQLHVTHRKAHSTWRALSKELGRTPTTEEIVAKLRPTLAEDMTAELGREVSEIELRARVKDIGSKVEWALSHEYRNALAARDTMWSFESRTLGNRRRLFTVNTDALCMAVVNQVVRSRSRDLQQVAAGWLESWNGRQAAIHAEKAAAGKARGEAKMLTFTKMAKGRAVQMDSRELEKVFEDKEMRTDFVGFALSVLPAARMESVWRLAMSDRIRAMGNQFRNHPIQGGVADAMLDAFGRIMVDMPRFPGAAPIQSVHDSIVIECDVEQAIEVRDMVVRHMQEALANFCPTVPCVADGDIQVSLSDKTILSEEQVKELYQAAA
jgi:DNA polymerase I-like protein with 3'-5' exonuclease and polymerase domains